jgi:hypothetical protein
MAALFALYLRAGRRAAGDGQDDDLALALGVALLATAAPLGLLLIHSGMETSLSLVVLAVNLIAIRAGTATPRQLALVVATTTLVYLTRPDAVAISLVVLVVHRWLSDRRPPWRAVAGCALALGAVLAACYLYFGTPLPLPFYLKSRLLNLYGDEFARLDLVAKKKNVACLLVMAAPLLYVAGHGRGPWRLALVASFVVFVAYHYLSTLEIMGYLGRFYLPAMVPLALAAIDAAPGFRARSRPLVTVGFLLVYAAVVIVLYRERMIYDGKDSVLTRVTAPLYAGHVAAAALLLLAAPLRARLTAALIPVPLVVAAVVGLPLPASLRLHDDATLLRRHIERYTTVRGIAAVRACLPGPLHIYHSEIGIPGVVFPRSTITDLAGLMDRDFAAGLGDGRFEARCAADRPEVIWLPHRFYKDQRALILGGACITGYRRMVKSSSSPLYVRADLAADFLTCARATGDRWVDGR